FVRAHGVVLVAKDVEALLLAAGARRRRPRRRAFERAVHALVPAVLLGVRGLDQLRINPEPDPPDAQLRQASQRARGEGHAIIGAENLRQTILLEEPGEHRPTLHRGRAAEAATAEQVAAIAILHGEREAVATITEAKLPFVVRSPDDVGGAHRRQRT